MQLFDEIKSELDILARSGNVKTKPIQETMERLALQYANANDLGFGDHTRSDPASRHPEASQYLCVHRDKHKSAIPFGTERAFLFDHCWLVFYNNKASSLLCSETGEYLEGYMSRCELVMESELGPKDEEFHRDFRKIVIARARYKIFLFQSYLEEECATAFQQLKTQVYSTEMNNPVEWYLISCFCGESFTHRSFVR